MSTTQTTPAPRSTDPDRDRDLLQADEVDRVAPEEPVERPTLAISATALVAGAAAAVTSAVVGSHLGTAGTLIGAALGSVIGAVATALYTYGLESTRHLAGRLAGARDARERRRLLTPRRRTVIGGVVIAALAAFAVALGVITGIERSTGTALDGTPGTTIQAAREAAGASSSRGDADGRDTDRAADPTAPPASSGPQEPTPRPSEPTEPVEPPQEAPSPEPTEPPANDPTPEPPAREPSPGPSGDPAPGLVASGTSTVLSD